MKSKSEMLVILIALAGGLFLCPGVAYSQEKSEKLEDLSRYGYTLKYKDPDVYTKDPGEKKSLYRQGQPALPGALSGREPPQREWSRPEDLMSQDLYKPPTELFPELFLPFTFVPEEKEVELEIETREGKVEPEVFAEKLVSLMELATGKHPKLSLMIEQTTPALVKPVAPAEEEEKERKEEAPKEESKDEWKLLLKKGRISLKAPVGTSQEDLEAIAAHLVDYLGRGRGVVAVLGPEGIEIKIK